MTRKEAEALTRKLARQFKESLDYSNALYSAQPQWSLSDFSVSSGEIMELLQEFMDFVDYTTSHFRWVTGAPPNEKELMKHGWKHITYDLIKELTDSDMSFLVPAAFRVDLVGTSEQFLDLIRQAENRVPQAVARLEFLFPRRDDLDEACKYKLFERIVRERLVS